MLGVIVLAVLMIIGTGSALAGDTDSIGLSLNVTGSETPTASETPEPTKVPGDQDDGDPAPVSALPNTGATPGGSSSLGVLALGSIAGFAFLGAAAVVRRRPTG